MSAKVVIKQVLLAIVYFFQNQK